LPIEAKHLDDGLGISLTVRGTLTGKELIKAIKEFYTSEKNLRKNKYGLLDYSSGERVSVSIPEVHTIADLSKKASKIAPDRIVAVVATQDLAFALSRMWEILSGSTNWERKVFRIKSEAKKWLKKKAKEKFNIRLTLK
jgi:hypothetical protein